MHDVNKDTDESLTGEELYTSLTVDVIPKKVSSDIPDRSASARAHGFTELVAIGLTTMQPLFRNRNRASAMTSAEETTCAAAACPMLLQLIRVVL
eukprot:6561928-Prymnesium_polylepis.1